MPSIDYIVLSWISIAYFSGAFILAVFFLNLYITNRKKFILKWTFTWALFSLAYIFLFYALYIDNMYLFNPYSLIIVSSGYVYLLANADFLKFKISKFLLYLLCFNYLFIFISFFFVDLIAWNILLAYMSNGLFFFISGYYFTKKDGVFYKITGYMTILFAFLITTYPFLGIQTWFMPWGYIIYGMVGLFMGVYLIQTYFVSQKKMLLALQDQLTYLTYHDSLTGIYNRMFLEEEFKKIVEKDMTNIGLLYIDINNFKQINDQYGHRKGDRVLTEFSQILNDMIAEEGYVCRFGGDEFIVILYDSSLKELASIKDTFMLYGENHLIDGLKIEYAIGTAFKKSVSEDIHELIDEAERSMYLLKSQQKN